MNQKLRLVLISVLIALAAALPGAGRAQSQTVYSGAVKDFLRPMEAFSRERKTEPELVMIHFISAVVDRRDDPFNLGSIRRIFLDGGISVHYLVDREGTVRCYVPEDRTALHAGRGEWADEKYTNRINRYSIGIEVAAIGSRQDMARYLTDR